MNDFATFAAALKTSFCRVALFQAMLRAVVLVALLGALAWQSAFVQTSGAGAKAREVLTATASGRLPDMAEAQDEGVAPLVSLNLGIMAGLLVALAGASPALAQRDQYGTRGMLDPESGKKLEEVAKPSGLLQELGSTSGDSKWAEKNFTYYGAPIKKDEKK